MAYKNVTIDEARQNALNALNDTMLFGTNRDQIRAASLLFSEDFPYIESATLCGRRDSSSDEYDDSTDGDQDYGRESCPFCYDYSPSPSLTPTQYTEVYKAMTQ